ncbi:MAG: FHA domain-containing protein [Verrucomicrobiota bacterium]
MNLPEILHICLTAKRDGKIHCVPNEGQEQLLIRNGEVIDATFGDLQGEDAFFAMLKSRPEVEFIEETVTDEATISKNTHYLLMEAARREDEGTDPQTIDKQSDSKEPPPTASSRCLVFITLSDTAFRMDEETMIIGRADDCTISVPDVSVSSHHSRIIWNGRDHLIDDLGSFNGTYINGEELQKAYPLQPGDIIQLGLCHFRYEVLTAKHDLKDPKTAIPFTFGSETQKIELPANKRATASQRLRESGFKTFTPVDEERKKKSIWPFGKK